ncbi:MAG: class I SAM-dependent methyltransferase [Gemmataceae bacterium]
MLRILPPPEWNFVGDGDFTAIGELLLRRFIDVGGLCPHHHVLDVGCGIGRMAIPLTGYLSSAARYEGFDIVPRGIQWCQEHITPCYPNFHFQWIDLYNQAYHPNGSIAPHRFCFPYADQSFDFVLLTSVFTHLLPAELENYLFEIARVLKIGGRCFATFFLLNPEARERIRLGKSAFDFRFGTQTCRCCQPHVPEQAVAYDEDHVLRLYQRWGLRVRHPIHHGSWCRETACLLPQDIVVATKTEQVRLSARLWGLRRLPFPVLSWPVRCSALYWRARQYIARRWTMRTGS